MIADYGSNNFTCEEKDEFKESLIVNTSIIDISSCSNIGLESTYISGKALKDILKSNQSIKSMSNALILDLAWNKIGPEGAKDLADGLMQNTSLIILGILVNRFVEK